MPAARVVMLRRILDMNIPGLHQISRFRALIGRAIDPALNLAILVVSIGIMFVFIRAGKPQSFSLDEQLKRNSSPVGSKVFLQAMDWSKSEHTLLMFLNTHCGFCKKSEPFYRKLSNEVTDQRQVRLIALFPQHVEEGKEYLDSAGIKVDDVIHPVSGDLKVTGTPTLVLVDKNGIATNEWIGFLSPSQETDVLTRVVSK